MEGGEPSSEAPPIGQGNDATSHTTVGPQTLLKSQATYRSGITSHNGTITNRTHEVELKMDREGLLSMDIYSPRTLVNSISLQSEGVTGENLPSFEVVQSNNSENILCVVHRTSDGLRNEFLVFQRREEMQLWIDKLSATLFPGKKRSVRRGTDPTVNRRSPNTKRAQKPSSATEQCFGGRSDSNSSVVARNSGNASFAIQEVEKYQSRHIDSHDIDLVESNSVDPSESTQCVKTPVEDYYQFHDDDPSSYGPVYLDQSDSINLQGQDQVNHSRSPSIATLYSAGESSQMARLGRTPMALSPDEKKHWRDIFSELCHEKDQQIVNVRVEMDDTLSIEFYTHHGKVWIKSCNSSARLLAGDLVKMIDNVEVKEERAAKNVLLASRKTQISFTIARLPHSCLLSIEKPATGEPPFMTEGTKIKWINVDFDVGLYEAVKNGNGYITHINTHHVPFGAGTTEIMSLLQQAGDEYFLILDHKDVAERLG